MAFYSIILLEARWGSADFGLGLPQFDRTRADPGKIWAEILAESAESAANVVQGWAVFS